LRSAALAFILLDPAAWQHAAGASPPDLALEGASTPQLALLPRRAAVKPERMKLPPHQNPGVIYVKLRDDSSIRLRGGELTDVRTGAPGTAAAALNAAALLREGGRWERLHQIEEATLSTLRGTAQARLGRSTADHNSEFLLHLPLLADARATIDAFNALEIVEIAWSMPLPTPPPTLLPPDYSSLQGYLGPSPGGVDATFAWETFGNRGAGIRFADCEYLFNPNHLDLPPVTILGPQPQDAGFGPNHGTAVLGEVGGLNQGWGVTGICAESTFHFAGTYIGGVVNVAAAITNCLGTFEAGDVIILEAQTVGPNYSGGGSQFGLVPVDWDLPVYNAVVTAVGSGIVLLEAAGNGQQNLDAPEYSAGNAGHWPFLLQNDSGAIIVGAGAAPGGSDVDRSRLWYSNYGATVDLQGWGEQVCTTGYGSLYSAQGPNLHYTSSFGGTSSATPIVAGAATLLQSIHKQVTGGVLSPEAVRQLLIDTGAPQQAGAYPATQQIGPRPNLAAAVLAAGLYCPADLSGDGLVGSVDLGLLLAEWGPCVGCPADFNDDGVVDAADLGALLASWGACG
jgi:subtilisin family serine protease